MSSAMLQRLAEQVLVGAVLALFWTGVIYLAIDFPGHAFFWLLGVFAVTCLIATSVIGIFARSRRHRLYRAADQHGDRAQRIHALQRQADHLALYHSNHKE